MWPPTKCSADYSCGAGALGRGPALRRKADKHRARWTDDREECQETRRQFAMALVELAEQMPPPLNFTKAPKGLLTALGPSKTNWAALTLLHIVILLHIIILICPHWGNSSHSLALHVPAFNDVSVSQQTGFIRSAMFWGSQQAQRAWCINSRCIRYNQQNWKEGGKKDRRNASEFNSSMGNGDDHLARNAIRHLLHSGK